MKRIVQSLFVFIACSSFAQDTTWVQTFTFDSFYTYRGKFFFPTANKSYRKILMYTNLKCYPVTSGDNAYPCGEWDRIATTDVYDHRGILDSTMMTGKLFTVNGAAPDSIQYTLTPRYDLYQYYKYKNVITQTASLNIYSLGTGSNSRPLGDSVEHAQFIWTASELAASGLTAGPVTGIRLQFLNSGGALKNLKIKMRGINADSIGTSFFTTDSLATVFFHDQQIGAGGWQDIHFTDPFQWDGTSAVLLDYSYDNTGSTPTGNALVGTATSYGSGLHTLTGRYCAASSLYGKGYIRCDSANIFTGSAPRTYEMWAMIDSGLSALFSSGRDGNVRFTDFTVEHSGNKSWRLITGGPNVTFTTSGAYGAWHHYAISYDGTTLRVYEDGNPVLQTNTTIKTETEIPTARMPLIIANWGTRGPRMPPQFSCFRIWDKALDQQTIREWANRDVIPAHPDYAHLRADYPISEGTGSMTYDHSQAGLEAGRMTGNIWWQKVAAENLFYLPQKLNWRPNIIFERGVYTQHLDSVLVTDTVMQQPTFVDMYEHPDGMHIIRDESPVNPRLRTDTRIVWDRPRTYTFLNGQKVDSVMTIRNQVLYNQSKAWFSNTVLYEISRAITPYGIRLDMGTGRTWIYDVTDYYDVLQDTVDLKAATNLELQDVRFAFIHGNPPAKVLRIHQPWFKGYGNFYFEDLAANTAIQPVDISLRPDAGALRIRPVITGHDFATSNQGGAYPHCCEFWSNKHYLYAGGQQIAAWDIFRNCGDNPLFPQGGTWTTPREGWCPGDGVHAPAFLVDLDRYASGGKVNIDYGINPVPANNPGLGRGRYLISLHAIEYGEPAKSNDAEIYDIRQPSDNFYYSRINPICNNPQIVIRNTGKNLLTSAVIKYSVSGGSEESYNWTGQLQFLESDTVTLPLSGPGFWGGDGKGIFTARIAGVNNTTDEYALNDTMRSRYEIPDNYNQERLIIVLKTNSRPSDNTLTIKDFNGNLVLSRTNLLANTIYRDTLALPIGCYSMTLEDKGHDGLSFWANTAQGSGYLQIHRTTQPFVMKTFNPDFGSSVYYPFTTGFPLKTPGITLPEGVTIFPNPNDGTFRIRIDGYTGKVKLLMTNVLGQQVMTDLIDCNGGMEERQYRLHLAQGVYLMKLDDGTTQCLRKIVID